MKFENAIAYLKDGYAIMRISWPQDTYLYIDTDDITELVFYFTGTDMQSDDWIKGIYDPMTFTVQWEK